MLDVISVSKHFGNHKALDNVSLTINQKEIIALLGVNGAGKTTLSSIIASLHPPTSGQVLYRGSSIYEDVIAYRKLLGFCAQKPNFSPHMTVKEHLFFSGYYYLMPRDAIQTRVDELLDLFGLGEYAHKSPAILSGGYKQRVLIARALVHRPSLVILDEPTVALDPHIRHALWEIIKNLKDLGVAVVLTTHYIDEAEMLADRICVLHAGRVQLIETPQALMNSYNKERLEDVFIQLINEQSPRNE